MSKLCPKGSPTPAYKGAWRGQHDGTGADTTWSPRLSSMRVLQGNPPWAYLRIRHELLRPIPPWSFQQLGCPVGNPPYNPDGPPWLAGLGLRRWYTYLVYPQQFCYTSWRFYAFSGTNLLTRCHSASSLFSTIFVFQKSYTGNILRIGRNKS
jgi:hypothetical protein